jgi:DNA-binding GntR family transcriptional regulator
VTTLAPTPDDPPNLVPIERARGRISDLVTEALTEAIRDLRLPPGSVLSETDLAAKLAVSRTPLREAISRLMDHGLLTVVPQVGTRVALIDLADVEQAVFIRAALETAAFRDASQQEQRDVDGLRRLLEVQQRAVGADDMDAFFEADEALHQEIFRLGGHPTVWSVLVRAKVQLDRLRRLSLPEAVDTQSLVDEHARIVDLLEAGETEVGSQVVNRHAHRAIDLIPVLRERHPAYFRH